MQATPTTREIPTPESVTPEWLTGILRASGHAGAEVRSFTAERIGTGQIGLCIRYTLDLARGDDRTPQSLVGKFPSLDPVSRQTGVQLRNYLKEVFFYREIRPRVTISVPRCYYAEIVGEGPEFALFLEDMRPAKPGDQLAGCCPDVARAAVLELVGLHAPTWRDTSLRGVEWIGEPNAERIRTVRELYASLLPGFLERYDGRLESDEAWIIERVAGTEGPLFEILGDPFSLVHVDYRLDNLLIDASRTPPRVTAVDWQSLTLGNPLSDVAYFLGAGLLPEDRRRLERDIVGEYHRALRVAGIEDYPWDRCWTDYRRGVFSGFAVTVIASMMVEQTKRGDDMFTAMARRHSRQALDLGSEEFLR